MLHCYVFSHFLNTLFLFKQLSNIQYVTKHLYLTRGKGRLWTY
nr:MAG TPA: hypothetical protein [Caudoviricetes sp.]